MADLPLTTVLGCLFAVPCVIVLTQEGEKANKVFAGVGVVLGAWIALLHYVDFLQRITSGGLLNVLAILSLALAIVLTIRHKQQALGTLMITAGALLTARSLGIVS